MDRSDCSIFGMGLEAAEQSSFFIGSKYLSFNVSDQARAEANMGCKAGWGWALAVFFAFGESMWDKSLD